MNEQQTPQPTPTAPTPAPPAAAALAPPKQPRHGGGERRPADGKRRPPAKPGPAFAVTDELVLPTPPKLRDLDADIAAELEATMAGFSEQELLTPEPKNEAETPLEQRRKKCKVHAIHGPDVFIDVPGGRSQGVLPMDQFPDGPPEVGSEVECQIEGYDRANGLLLLTRWAPPCTPTGRALPRA